MLKKIRVTAALFFIAALTLLFLDYTGTVHKYLGWAARAQFVPAILAHSVVIIALWLVVTLLFGRVYCSTICPLGIWQDVISRKASWFGKKKNRFSYRKPRKALVILRFAILGMFVIALVLHIPFVSTLTEPYSAYGRMISQIFGPLYKYGNNILAGFAERAGSYAFYSVDVWMKSAGALAVSVVTLITISVFAVKSGRGYCNTICPVGALLGIISKFALVKNRIDKDKCAKCGVCAKNCKAGCIDPSTLDIDYSRCVVCFNCIGSCPKDGIRYSAAVKKTSLQATGENDSPLRSRSDIAAKDTKSAGNTSVSDIKGMDADGLARRNVISGAVTLALGAASAAFARTYDFDGGLAPLEDKKPPQRKTPVIPPGSQNARNFRRHCTGCQLCVSACPSGVLRPSSKLSEFMQPHMSFERGYCRTGCVRCSRVCPTGAIRGISVAEKSSTQIGYAVWNKELCVVNVDNVQCDLCSRKCPVGAITQIHRDAGDESSLKIPMVDTARCIGCGACEHLCPSRPFSAIYVEGVDTHRTI